MNKYFSFIAMTLIVFGAVAQQNIKLSSDKSGFVRISDVVPDVILEIRYFGTYNFVGTRVDGYEAPTAWLTRQAVDSLKAVSDDVKALGYRLKIRRPLCSLGCRFC